MSNLDFRTAQARQALEDLKAAAARWDFCRDDYSLRQLAEAAVAFGSAVKGRRDAMGGKLDEWMKEGPNRGTDQG